MVKAKREDMSCALAKAISGVEPPLPLALAAARIRGVGRHAADRQTFFPRDDAVPVDVEPREHPRHRRLQFGEGDAIVAVAIHFERAGQRIGIAQPARRPVGEVDIAERAGVSGVDRSEAARHAGGKLGAGGAAVAVAVERGDRHRDRLDNQRCGGLGRGGNRRRHLKKKRQQHRPRSCQRAAPRAIAIRASAAAARRRRRNRNGIPRQWHARRPPASARAPSTPIPA
ncbi:hypothetical protein WR25_11167 [Diploscapter pachys]|uniref:Uncharacterized protein n=1 Tax=Diploscapter pachys TaxID=2018661 RepID=A0A2A2M485_9BILA|nr:hypothetical protein WR25_11167 [Diploscapter pachys]